MITMGQGSRFRIAAFGLLLAALVLVAAEMLARRVEADAARRRAASLGRPAQITAIHAVVAEEFR